MHPVLVSAPPPSAPCLSHCPAPQVHPASVTAPPPKCTLPSVTAPPPSAPCLQSVPRPQVHPASVTAPPPSAPAFSHCPAPKCTLPSVSAPPPKCTLPRSLPRPQVHPASVTAPPPKCTLPSVSAPPQVHPASVSVPPPKCTAPKCTPPSVSAPPPSAPCLSHSRASIDSLTRKGRGGRSSNKWWQPHTNFVWTATNETKHPTRSGLASAQQTLTGRSCDSHTSPPRLSMRRLAYLAIWGIGNPGGKAPGIDEVGGTPNGNATWNTSSEQTVIRHCNQYDT